MSKNDQIGRRSMLKTAALGASSVAAGTLVPTEGNAETPKDNATQVPVKLRIPD